MNQIAKYSGDSMASRARLRRMVELNRRFPEIAEMEVVDLGGTCAFWLNAMTRPKHVTVVNLQPEPPPADWISVVNADACTYRGTRADLVVSNSLIEHVGGHARREQLAEVIGSLSSNYWVQTPYRYFPIEPHWLFPGFQFLPLWAQTEVALRWKRGHITANTRQEARHEAMWVELLTVSEMESLFPKAEIWRERFGGLTKSLVAVSTG